MKKKSLLFVVLALSLCVLMALSACQKQPAETTPTGTEGPTEPSAPAKEKFVVYWNLDRAAYADAAREKGADGLYSVQFVVDGKVTAMKVKDDAELIKKIDSMDIMGLELDDSKTVIGVKTVEEMGGKIVAEGFYVKRYENARITAYEKSDLSGKTESISVGFTTYITDVTTDKPQSLYSLFLKDQIVAVEDDTGAVTNVYMFKGGEIRCGRDEYCEHCDQEVHWEAWTDTTTIPVSKSGHFYLYYDVVASRQMSMSPGVELILDLNGKTVTRDTDRSAEGTGRVISIHESGAYLAVMDHSTDKTGTIKTFGNAYANGCAVWLRSGNFDLYSGTIDGSPTTNTACGTVYVSAGMTFNMYGGTIIGGTTVSAIEEEKDSSGGNGASVYVLGTFNMYDGVIENGLARAAGEGIDRGYGGNVFVGIYQGTPAVFNMSGGEIRNGVAETAGNNVYVVEGATFNQTGGTLTEKAPEAPETPEA